MGLTSAQREAVSARGNVLVVAGAGTGKTRTLVERCLSCLLDEVPPASLDEILVVTFTEAAAAEMRQRIRARLEQELKQHQGQSRWQEQLALFETAHIGTLHSFCLRLVRQHFYELELDPQLSVLAEEEARLLASETLDAVLQKHYAGRGSTAEAVQQLIQTQGRGSDEAIRALVLRLHHYTQTLPNAAGWFHAQLEMFASPEPAAWREWLPVAIADWRERWLPLLERSRSNEVAGNCEAALRSVPAKPARPEAVLEKVVEAAEDCQRGKKTEWLKPLREFMAEAEFLLSLARGAPASASETTSSDAQMPGTDPLAEDWGWVRTQMTTLLELAQEFSTAFGDAKRELGMVDFHDLEQHALRLLWDAEENQPTKVAQHWRKKLRFIFVDEYQDINAAQDKIIQALGREEAQANRFLVGDVKQSIYRFRLANPAIFQGYVRTWGQGAGRVIPLTDNFRSREGILDFLNSVFTLVMRREVGGVLYDEQARLRFGAASERSALQAGSGTPPCVELHLRVKDNANQQEPGGDSTDGLAEVKELEEAEKEARLVGLRLHELKSRQHPIWDEEAKQFRPVEWSDMAVLLRSPANKAESYAKEFSRLKVPLLVERGGFYQSLEITDLLSLLQMLDNPLQDLPVLAVLHSPLVGLTPNELAAIRLTVAKTSFWTALVQWVEIQSQVTGEERRVASDGAGLPIEGQGPVAQHAPRNPQHDATATDSAETLRKVVTFLERFARWRQSARQESLSRCLEAVLTETHYADWLLTQPRGEQRHANVQRLLGLAQQFDLFQRQGLFRFLRFVEAQQLAETEPEVAAVSEENSVRLMSIHQSKGLEFPVVVVADLGKPFNLSDLRADVILDEQYGLCPQIKPPHTGKRYPSLPYWLACRRQHRELLGEELRLLYVAMTRARDLLVLSATLSEAMFKRWSAAAPATTVNAGQTFLSAGDGDFPVASSPLRPGKAGAPADRNVCPTERAAAAAAMESARCFADWLGLWVAQNCELQSGSPAQGQNEFLRWAVHENRELIAPPPRMVVEAAESEMNAAPAVWQALQHRLAWRYSFSGATRQPAKTSVSVLRRQAAETDEEAGMVFPVRRPKSEGRSSTGEDELQEASGRRTPGARHSTPRPAQQALLGAAADVGKAHHRFLEFVSLQRVNSAQELKQEAERLEREGVLSAEQCARLDFNALAAFWNSELGLKVRAQTQSVHRELAFTARFLALELAALSGLPAEPGLEGEFMVVQGVADLVVLLPKEIWLIDFKTDRVRPEELGDKAREYEPQLKLYARALSQIYRRPVAECWLYLLALQASVPIETRNLPLR